MIVPSYVQADNWTLVHLLWPDASTTWCGIPLSNVVDLRDAPAPDIEPVGVRHYCLVCEGQSEASQR